MAYPTGDGCQSADQSGAHGGPRSLAAVSAAADHARKPSNQPPTMPGAAPGGAQRQAADAIPAPDSGQLELPLPGTLSTPGGDADVVLPTVHAGGRALHPTPVFTTYWRFAAKRMGIYLARIAGRPWPWTDDPDPVLLRYRFTNCYRAADRVSQYLIRHVSYTGSQQPEEIVFRTLLFKLYNRVSTWELLSAALGELTWGGFDVAAYDQVLTEAFTRGQSLYSAAYLMPPPRPGTQRKHTSHLQLLGDMMSGGIVRQIMDAGSLQAVFGILRSWPGLGDFLAFQYSIDLNYSGALRFDEMEFVVPGPGARDGIRKCFGRDADGIEAGIIRHVADHQAGYFERLGLEFPGLWGRPLQLVDCQNLFCEVDKYARVAHPGITGHSGRSRIKQRFRPVTEPVTAWFPPKWHLPASPPRAARHG